MYIGTNLNDYQDALDLGGYSDRWINELRPRRAARRACPRTCAPRWSTTSPTALQAHRRDLPEDATAWGWKEPRSIYLLPFFNSVMPRLRFLHWMRDGRDMAFSENQQQLRKHGQTVLGPSESAG